MLKDAGVESSFGVVPQGVDVYPRTDGRRTVYVVVNFSSQPQTIKVPSAVHSVLDDAQVSESIHLERFGVAVLEKR